MCVCVAWLEVKALCPKSWKWLRFTVGLFLEEILFFSLGKIFFWQKLFEFLFKKFLIANNWCVCGNRCYFCRNLAKNLSNLLIFSISFAHFSKNYLSRFFTTILVGKTSDFSFFPWLKFQILCFKFFNQKISSNTA